MYKLVEPTYDLTSGSNWLMLLKFWGVNIVVSIVVAILIVVILKVFMYGANADDSVKETIGGIVNGGLMAMIPIVVVVLMGQMYTLSWFEQADGCHKKSSKE